ncbi:unnamed protein product [Somion occarium]|uniref:G protein-coupled receptor n=1 Tax=Somion occarium TaxID=3059160 RepID=A0ABP1CH59_9APHY
MASQDRSGSNDKLPDLSYLSTLFFTLHIASGHVGLPLLVIILTTSKRIRRPPSVINLCITWIVFSVSHCLLFYGGYHGHYDPPFALCLVQAAMIHGAPPMCVIGVFILVLHVWYLLQPPWHPFLICYTNNVSPFVRLALVVLPPYLVFISICIGVVLTGLYRPSSVVSSLGLYCTIVDMDSVFSVPVFCAVFMVLILILNLGTLVQYCWRWYALMKVNPLFSRSTSLNIWLRVFIFSLYSFATLGACLTLIFDKRSPVSYVVQAGLPPVALLIFGSQKDMWHAACFWRTESAERKMSDGGWSAPVDTISTSTVGIESSIV